MNLLGQFGPVGGEKRRDDGLFLSFFIIFIF